MTARIHTRDPSGHSLIPWPEANFSHHGCILDGTASMTISDLWWTHDALPKLSHQSRWIGEFFSLFTLLPHSLSDVWIQISVFEHLTEEEYLMSQLLTITKLIYCKSRKFWISVNIWNNNSKIFILYSVQYENCVSNFHVVWDKNRDTAFCNDRSRSVEHHVPSAQPFNCDDSSTCIVRYVSAHKATTVSKICLYLPLYTCHPVPCMSGVF